MAVYFLLIAFLIYGAQSQICPGIFPGNLIFDQIGSQPVQIATIPQQICPGSCGQQQFLPFIGNNIANALPQCGNTIQPCANAIQPCGNAIQPCANAIQPCANAIQPCANAIPSCANAIPACGNILPQNIAPYLNSIQGIGPSNFLPQSLVPSLIPSPTNCAPLIPQLTPSVVNSCQTSPVVATTVVDNTLANSLANAIQLLIVSNLIENTLGSNLGCSSFGSCSNLGSIGYDTVGSLGSLFEIVSPDFGSCCDYSPVIDVPCIQEQIISYQSPCADSCYNSFGPVVNTLVETPCGYNGFQTIDACNSFGTFSNTVPNFGCIDNAVGTLAPVAAEVVFPSAIPAQLTCNFGYMNTNVPCVSVNVEALPFDCGFGNGYYC